MDEHCFVDLLRTKHVIPELISDQDARIAFRRVCTYYVILYYIALHHNVLLYYVISCYDIYLHHINDVVIPELISDQDARIAFRRVNNTIQYNTI
jgi:hypothetical protein